MVSKIPQHSSNERKLPNKTESSLLRLEFWMDTYDRAKQGGARRAHLYVHINAPPHLTGEKCVNIADSSN